MRRPTLTRPSRRTVLAGLAAAPLTGCIESLGASATAAQTSAGVLEITSPAPPTNPLHKLNLQLLEVMASDPSLIVPKMPAVALPESINKLVGLSSSDRARSLPIVTTVDFGPARTGSGPAWHSYDRKNADLKFVTRLYDVGFGIHLFDRANTSPTFEDLKGKRIAAPPRPSAVRMMTEALLRDGWGILDDVTLVDMVPTQIAAALAAGEIDGTSWNLVLPMAAGMAPMMAAPETSIHYIPVSIAEMERFNAANDFSTGLAPMLAGGPPLISFGQALAAWDDTDPALVNGTLRAMLATGGRFIGYPANASEMKRWPLLPDEAVHPVAQRFYASL